MLTTIVTFCAFRQPAQAQAGPPHIRVRMVPRVQRENINPSVVGTVPTALFPLWQAFTTYAIDPTTGFDEWICDGGHPECPTINPLGLVVGRPDSIWPLADCEATSTATPSCGQFEVWYEDATDDSTDDLLFRIVATQGENYIYDSGINDFGPVVGATYPRLGAFSGDANFGTMGQTGKNNGNCSADYNYPFPALPGVFVITENETCVAPVAGPVNITATIKLATSTWTYKNGVPYKVSYTVQYKITQEWTIYLQ